MFSLSLIHITENPKGTVTPKNLIMFQSTYFSIDLGTMKIGKWKKTEAVGEPYVSC